MGWVAWGGLLVGLVGEVVCWGGVVGLHSHFSVYVELELV